MTVGEISDVLTKIHREVVGGAKLCLTVFVVTEQVEPVFLDGPLNEGEWEANGGEGAKGRMGTGTFCPYSFFLSVRFLTCFVVNPV